MVLVQTPHKATKLSETAVSEVKEITLPMPVVATTTATAAACCCTIA
jgi:hypothetical protein